MNVLDLFSGIGGFSLGLERAGMRTVAFCEIDPYCRAVLAKHWPDVPCYDDILTLSRDRLVADGIIAEAMADAERGSGPEATGVALVQRDILAQAGRSQASHGFGVGSRGARVDVICGGFPCQDISNAGKRAGIGGERSGLWAEYARLIGEIRPRYAVIENVSALLGRGLSRVLGDLAALGFDAEWHCIPASAVGAPHRRDRVWIVANARCERSERWRGECGGSESAGPRDRASRPSEHAVNVADADEPRLEGWLREFMRECASERPAGTGRAYQWDERRWFAQSGMGRISHGTANRVDRLRSLGNAVVPQIPEMIGRAIMAAA